MSACIAVPYMIVPMNTYAAVRDTSYGTLSLGQWLNLW